MWRSILLPQTTANIIKNTSNYITKHNKPNYTIYTMLETIQENSEAERPQSNNDPVLNPVNEDAEDSSLDFLPELEDLVNKLIEMTWKLMAIAKYRSESFFHKNDPIFFTANITQKVVESFCQTLVYGEFVQGHGRGSPLAEDILELLPEIVAVQEEMFDNVFELYCEVPRPREATDEVAKDILLLWDKVDAEEKVKAMARLRLHRAANINE